MNIVIKHGNMHSITDQDQTEIGIQDVTSLEKAGCDSIHMADCMDYVPLGERDKLLSSAVERLRYGGKLTLSGTDIYALGTYINQGLIGMAQVNASLYDGRLSIDHLHNVLTKLESVDMDIENAKLDGLYFAITARRKDVSGQK